MVLAGRLLHVQNTTTPLGLCLWFIDHLQMLDPALGLNNCLLPSCGRFLPLCPTFARVLDFIRIQELHEHLEGLRLSLSDGHFQQRLQAAQLDIPTNPIPLTCSMSLVFNILL